MLRSINKIEYYKRKKSNSSNTNKCVAVKRWIWCFYGKYSLFHLIRIYWLYLLAHSLNELCDFFNGFSPTAEQNKKIECAWINPIF